MALSAKTFGELFTYTRGSGATRVNAAGLIVGVDFSSTSHDVTTGSKSFTLAADLNVNRDWAMGSAVRAVGQVGGQVLRGTVTSYTPSTQALVINVTSVTGSGTGLTNWRIGSLEFRRDFDPVTLQAKGGLVEGGATNILTGSETISESVLLAAGTGVAPTKVANSGITPAGSNTAYRSVFSLNGGATTGDQSIFRFNTASVTGLAYVGAVYIRSFDSSSYVMQLGFNNENYTTITVTPQWQRVSVVLQNLAANTTRTFQLRIAGGQAIANSNTVDILLAFPQLISAASLAALPPESSSYIPTTTVSVTRAADLLSIGGTNFSQFYNSAQGTLVMELTPIASAVGAVAGSLNDGTVNNAIRIAQKQSGTLSSIRKMATDGVTDVMAVNAATGNTLRSNGVDYTETPDQSGVVKLGAASSAVGQFLTVGGAENFRSSADSGLTYNARTIGGTFGGAHFGIGRFVIAGSTSTINGATVGSVIVSPDGLALRRINIPGLTQQLNEVTSNGTNQYVAVGNGGVIYTSPDAETWTVQTSGTTNAINGITYNGTNLYVSALSSTTTSIRTSPDGVTWTARTTANASLFDVAYNGTNLYVAVGSGGSVQSSPDGTTWTARTSNTTQQLNGVHFADGLWVAVGNDGTVITSPDGTTWTDRTANSGTTQAIQEVNFFSGKFYYVGNAQVIGENTAANIAANVTWTARTANVTATLNGIATNGSRLLICGTSGAITTSEDGTTFTSRTGNGTQINGAAFGAGTYVIVGNAANGSGLIATVNPTTFEYQRRVSGVTVDILAVSFLVDKFVASPNGGLTIPYSSDGITWNQSTTNPLANTSFVAEPAFGNSLYVMCNSSNSVMYSTNGIAWTQGSSLPSGFNCRALAFSNGIFVAVSNTGAIATTPNPQTTAWTARTSGVTSSLRSVTYSTRDQQWYAAGDGGVILRSADAITWTSIANDAIGAVINSGVVQSNPTLADLNVGAVNKVAMRLKPNNFGVSVNGADAVVDVSGSLPAPNRFTIGATGTGASFFNGWIRKATYFPIDKTDAELKELST